MKRNFVCYIYVKKVKIKLILFNYIYNQGELGILG